VASRGEVLLCTDKLYKRLFQHADTLPDRDATVQHNDLLVGVGYVAVIKIVIQIDLLQILSEIIQ
jgi:hypothetical protein